jgi:hypothetical protein
MEDKKKQSSWVSTVLCPFIALYQVKRVLLSQAICSQTLNVSSTCTYKNYVSVN